MSEHFELSKTLSVVRDGASERVETVNRIFGLSASASAEVILQPTRVPSGGITFITGYSGTGKSTLLRLIREHLPEARTLPEVEAPETPVIDLFQEEVGACMRLLGKFGLADARLMTTPFAALSDGQKVRVRLALLMRQSPRVVVIDEFLSLLDRLNAKVVAFNFQKMCRRAGTVAYVASAHDDLIAPLGPDQVIRLGLDGTPTFSRPSEPASLPELAEITVGPGTREDYEALARFHPLDSNAQLDWENTVREARVARFRGQPVGVLVSASPFSRAFDRLTFFRELNRSVAVSVRTIVHPAFRGVGLSAMLEPDFTDSLQVRLSISAMSRYVPFHLANGFEPVELPRNRRLPEHEVFEALLRLHGGRDLMSLHRPGVAQSFYDALPADARAEVRRQALGLVIRTHVDSSIFLAELLGRKVNDSLERPALEALFARLMGLLPEDQMGLLIDEALHLPVVGYVKRRARPEQPPAQTLSS